MTTPVFVTGWEHGATPTTNGAGIADLITATPAVVTSPVHSGSYALEISTSAAAENWGKNFSASDRAVVRFYFRFNTLPSANCKFAYLRVGAGSALNVRFVQSTSKVRITWGTSTGQQDSSMTISANTWYRIDLDILVNAATRTCDWKIDGTSQTRADSTETASNATGIRLGTDTTDTYTCYYDDLVYSITAADYPIGAGGTEALLPASDGTHNAGTNIIEDNAGTDIGATAAYDKINSVPPSATTYIRQAAVGTGNYAEVNFANIAATHNGIIGAMGVLAYTSETTTANNGGCIISKDAFSTSTTIHGASGALADYSDGSTSNLYFKSALLANVTDDTTVNALQARLGYSGDATPDPYWIDLIVEVAYTVASGLSATVNQVTETDTAQAIGRVKYKPVAQISETDSAQPITKVKRLAVAQVTETDLAQAIAKMKIRAVAQASETDLAQPVTRPSITVSVGQVLETDAAQAVTSRKVKSVGQVSETDSAQTVTGRKLKLVGQVSENDIAQVLTARKIKAIAQVMETDLAQALTVRKVKTVAQVTETDLAQALTVRKIKTVAQVTETDLAQAISRLTGILIQQVDETDLAQALTVRKIKTVAQVTETDAAQAMTVRKIKTVAQVIETDLAQAINRLAGILIQQVDETDLAQAIFPMKRVAIAQAVEFEFAQAMGRIKILTIGQVVEIDLAQLVSPAGLVALGIAWLSDRVVETAGLSDGLHEYGALDNQAVEWAGLADAILERGTLTDDAYESAQLEDEPR